MGSRCYHRCMEISTESNEPTTHRYLSAPWRMRYLDHGAGSAGCVFCEKLAAENDIDNLIVWRGATIAIVMNLYPYSTGHLMIMPYAHVASPEDLGDPQIMSELALELPSTMRAMRRVLRCQGFNTGMNTGAVAGAGIADHMHMHLVPRWGGDANYMPIIANTTVMPEALSVTYAKLRAELAVEHDSDWLPEILVLSEDRTHVFVPTDPEGMAPVRRGDREHSLVSAIGAALSNLGVDATVAGWTGADTIVWQATTHSNPASGGWVPIAALPGNIVSLARDAANRLTTDQN